jgi:general secretion pathway protein J
MRAINNLQRTSHSKGFTLLEMLIALSLFALIGILSNRLLTTTVQIDERMEQQFNEQLVLRQLFLILHDDLEQMVPRQTRTPDGVAPIFFQDSSADAGAVSFVRGGYGNNFAEDTKRSRLVRVRYQVGKHPDRDKPDSRYYRDEKTYLLRSISTTLDVGSATDADDVVVQALLPNISRFNLLPLFGGGSGFGERALPLLPKSVLVELSGQSFGSLTHTIMVR